MNDNKKELNRLGKGGSIETTETEKRKQGNSEESLAFWKRGSREVV